MINILRQASKSYGRQEIVSIRGAQRLRFAYRDSYRRVRKLGNALKAIGAEVGDRIGVLDWNTHRHFECYFGIPGIGSVLLLLNLRLSPVDLVYVINHAETKYVLVDETLLPLAEAVAGQCPGVKGYIVLTDRDLADVKTKLSPVYSYERLLADACDGSRGRYSMKNPPTARATRPARPGVPKGCITRTAMSTFTPWPSDSTLKCLTGTASISSFPCFTPWDGACRMPPF